MDMDSVDGLKTLHKRSQIVLANAGFPRKIEDIEERRFLVYYAFNGTKEIFLEGRISSVTIEMIEKGANKGEYVYLKPYPCLFNDCEVVSFVIYSSGRAVIKLDTKQRSISNEFEVHFKLLDSWLKRIFKRMIRLF